MFLGRPKNIIMHRSPRDIFDTPFGHLSTNFMQIWKLFYVFLFMFTYISVCLFIVNIEKIAIEKSILKNILEKDVLRTSR